MMARGNLTLVTSQTAPRGSDGNNSELQDNLKSILGMSATLAALVGLACLLDYFPELLPAPFIATILKAVLLLAAFFICTTLFGVAPVMLGVPAMSLSAWAILSGSAATVPYVEPLLFQGVFLAGIIGGLVAIVNRYKPEGLADLPGGE